MSAPDEAHNSDRSLANARAGSPEALAPRSRRTGVTCFWSRKRSWRPTFGPRAGPLTWSRRPSSRRSVTSGSSGEKLATSFVAGCGGCSCDLGTFAQRYRGTDMRDVGREVEISAGSSAGGPGGELAAASATPSGLAMANEQSLELQGALDRLRDDYRCVIQLRYDDNLTFEQIGQEMGRSPEAARKLWARAMDCLRDEWRSAR